jgi:hypothetical protein
VLAEARQFLVDLDQSRAPSGRRARSANGRKLIDQSREMIDRTHDRVRDSQCRVGRLARTAA